MGVSIITVFNISTVILSRAQVSSVSLRGCFGFGINSTLIVNWLLEQWLSLSENEVGVRRRVDG